MLVVCVYKLMSTSPGSIRYQSCGYSRQPRTLGEFQKDAHILHIDHVTQIMWINWSIMSIILECILVSYQFVIS